MHGAAIPVQPAKAIKPLDILQGAQLCARCQTVAEIPLPPTVWLSLIIFACAKGGLKRKVMLDHRYAVNDLQTSHFARKE